MWLLDTNVISELRKAKPDTNVVSWVIAQRADSLHTADVCLAEIQVGILAQADHEKRAELSKWFDKAVVPMFHGRTLPATHQVLVRWLRLVKTARELQRPAPPVDMLIAATALATQTIAVTRDVTPFLQAEAKVFNPFTGERFNGA